MFTPYKAAKIVNAALEAAEVDKQIPPQMMYNYTTARVNKGKTPLIECVTINGQTLITEAGLTKWLEAYMIKQGVVVEAVEDNDEIEGQLTLEDAISE
jgi:hypothetical protein